MASYGWGDEVETSDSNFTVLDEGEYPFIVSDFERGRVKSGKLAGCDQAVYTLHVTPEGQPSTELRYFIPLDTSLTWKATQFFKAIGAIPADTASGTKVSFPWGEVTGLKGKVELGLRQYKNDKGEDRTANEIVRVMPLGSKSGDYGSL